MSKQARNALMVFALFLVPPLVVAEERINPVDGAVMVRVPAGEFVMGKKGSESHFRDERYSHKVQLSEFWIYMHEVTNAQWLKFIDATGYAHRASLDIHGLDEADHPVVAVSWQDAAAYCKWAKMSLPTETQWEYAARGPKANVWPWGDKFDPGKVSWALGMKRPGTSPVGRHPEGASWCGSLDMAGNAWEWCLDWYIYGYPSSPDNRDPVQLTKPGSSRERKILRGGGWIQVGGWQGKNGYQLRGSYRYGAALWKHRSIYNGFRCASGDISRLDAAGKLESRAAPRKTGPSYYTQEEIRSIRANIKKYPWAADQMKVSGHVSYLSPGLSDDLAWSRLTSQDVPRAYKAKYWPVCPLCKKPGTKFFGIVYKVDGARNTKHGR